jgi:hypothetical protein
MDIAGLPGRRCESFVTTVRMIAHEAYERLISQRTMQERKDAFLFVNKRLEGNAPSTMDAVVEILDGGITHGPPF